jgi:hypothetical protein
LGEDPELLKEIIPLPFALCSNEAGMTMQEFPDEYKLNPSFFQLHLNLLLAATGTFLNVYAVVLQQGLRVLTAGSFSFRRGYIIQPNRFTVLPEKALSERAFSKDHLLQRRAKQADEKTSHRRRLF